MDKINFDSVLFNHIKNILELSYDYVNDSYLVKNIYIYISFEWVVFYDVLYKVDNGYYERHNINRILQEVDTSINSQKLLIKNIKIELDQIKDLFVEDNREIPTQIKIIYSPQTRKNQIKFNYEKFHNDELLIGDDALAEEWFEQIQRGEGNIK